MIRSLQALKDFASPLVSVSLTANSISQVLYTSKGREAFLALLQYCAELYKECMKDYTFYNAAEHWTNSVQNARSVEHSMSSGRKMIRLFRFLDEVGEIERLLDRTGKWQVLPVLQLLSHACSFLYYVLDNLVLASSIGVISHVIAAINVRWKSTKDMSSLIRVLLAVTIACLSLRDTRKSIKSARNQLHSGSKGALSPAESLRKLFEDRRKLRFLVLDLSQNSLRLLMLMKALELPGHRLLSPILVAALGVLSTSIAVFKQLSAAL